MDIYNNDQHNWNSSHLAGGVVGGAGASGSGIYDGNNSTSTEREKNNPPGFTEDGVPLVAAYCVMFVIAAAGNLSVIITLFRSKRHRRSRISLMICHLAVADLIVAFFMIPLEIGWRITVEWKAGNVACKVFLFLRAFCLYLSSNVLVCVSLDRCFAVIYPLRVTDARRRGKIMLLGAWIIAVLNALPQSIVFQVQVHPDYPAFRQCVTFESFSNKETLESAYNLFCLIAMYFVPLLIISIAYSAIVCEISNRSNRRHNDGDSVDNETSNNGAVMLRCNALSQIERARQRTFRLTITIVVGFIWCWTPYVVMASWYIIDKESAGRVNKNIQDGLFLMAVSNSCLNPLIYSTYSMRRCRFPWTRKRSKDAPVGAKTELQRRSTDAGSGIVDARHTIAGRVQKFKSLKIMAGGGLPSLNNGILSKGTVSRTSVLTKLTNARSNVPYWNKHNVINEMEMGSPNYNNRNTKMLFSDNGKCLISHKHHHSSKNLCSSQGNSASNTNEDIEERASSSSGRMSANFKESGIKIKRSPERDLTGDGGAFVDGKPSSIFYCISLGDLKTIPSQSSLNYVSARPSFYSDPTRQCDADSKM